MPYFIKNRAWQEKIRTQVADVRTIEDLRIFALSYKIRSVGDVLVQFCDRLTEKKADTTQIRMGRWRWENIQAGMGRRLQRTQLLDNRILYSLMSLIARFNGVEKIDFGGLRKTGWAVPRYKYLHDLRRVDRFMVAYDICDIVLEEIEKRKPPG